MEHATEQPQYIETFVYGGMFDPPTIMHRNIAQGAIDLARQNHADVWIMPSGTRIDKPGAINIDRRLEYIDALVADVDATDVNLSVYTKELYRGVPVETFDTVLELNDTYPDRRFTWVFGADSTETMGDWHMGPWLLANLSMLLVERDGYAINPQVRHAQSLKVAQQAISSTAVRNGYAAGDDVSWMLTPHVQPFFSRI